MIVSKIIEVANNFIGLTEKIGNTGFNEDLKIQEYLKSQFPKWDMSLEELFKTVGWEAPQPWCVYTSEVIWKLAYTHFDSSVVEVLDRVFSGGAVKTYNNFLESDFEVVDLPQPGALVIFQNYKNGKAQWSGHAGIVTEVKEDGFQSIEGNTNDKGGREGYIISKKNRKVNYTVQNGLRLKGFILPKEV